MTTIPARPAQLAHLVSISLALVLRVAAPCMNAQKEARMLITIGLHHVWRAVQAITSVGQALQVHVRCLLVLPIPQTMITTLPRHAKVALLMNILNRGMLDFVCVCHPHQTVS